MSLALASPKAQRRPPNYEHAGSPSHTHTAQLALQFTLMFTAAHLSPSIYIHPPQHNHQCGIHRRPAHLLHRPPTTTPCTPHPYPLHKPPNCSHPTPPPAADHPPSMAIWAALTPSPASSAGLYFTAAAEMTPGSGLLHTGKCVSVRQRNVLSVCQRNVQPSAAWHWATLPYRCWHHCHPHPRQPQCTHLIPLELWHHL